jgi:hypothetical protein
MIFLSIYLVHLSSPPWTLSYANHLHSSFYVKGHVFSDHSNYYNMYGLQPSVNRIPPPKYTALSVPIIVKTFIALSSVHTHPQLWSLEKSH